jgi:hypothetical protein
MHTDPTLAILDKETTALGYKLREFQAETCSVHPTLELKREANARGRRERKRQSTTGTGLAQSQEHEINQRQSKEFNLQTYKVHALGDYVATIKRYGTTDSYTSEIVRHLHLQFILVLNVILTLLQGELEHRNSKTRYKRTSKKKFVRQIVQIERRQARIRLIRQKLKTRKEYVSQEPEAHHHIGISENHPQHFGQFLRAHIGDPATKVH